MRSDYPIGPLELVHAEAAMQSGGFVSSWVNYLVSDVLTDRYEAATDTAWVLEGIRREGVNARS